MRASELVARVRALPTGRISSQAWLMIVGASVNRLGAFLQIFLVLYLTSKGMAPTGAGAVLAAYGVGSVIGVGVGGATADRWGPRATVVTSMSVTAVTVISFTLTTEFRLLLPLAVLAGGAAQLFRPAASALIAAQTAPGDLVAVMGVYRLGINVGSTAGPLIGGALFLWAPGSIFVVDAVTSAAFAVIAFVGLRVPPGHTPDAVAVRQDSGNLREMFADWRFLLVVVGQFFTCLVEIQYLVALPLYLRDEGVAMWVFTGVVALNGALVIFFELAVIWLLRRWALRTRIAVGSGLIGVGLSFFGVDVSLVVVLLATLIWTFGEMMCASAVSAYPGLVAPPRLAGRYYGAWTMGQTAGFAVGPALGGFLYEVHGAAVWGVCAVGGVVAFLTMMAGVRHIRPVVESE